MTIVELVHFTSRTKSWPYNEPTHTSGDTTTKLHNSFTVFRSLIVRRPKEDVDIPLCFALKDDDGDMVRTYPTTATDMSSYMKKSKGQLVTFQKVIKGNRGKQQLMIDGGEIVAKKKGKGGGRPASKHLEFTDKFVVKKGKEEPYFQCDQCSYVSACKYTFARHCGKHTGEKVFQCDLCGKRCSIKHNLKRHISTMHQGVRRFSCDMCSREFAEKRNLDEHYRTHTGEKPYVCENCGKRFAQRVSLSSHIRFESKHRNYKCHLCDKSYVISAHLQDHLKTTHTTKRDFMCSACGKMFPTRKLLTIHSEVHSTNRSSYSCDICHAKYKSKRTLTAHLRIHKKHLERAMLANSNSSPGLDSPVVVYPISSNLSIHIHKPRPKGSGMPSKLDILANKIC